MPAKMSFLLRWKGYTQETFHIPTFREFNLASTQEYEAVGRSSADADTTDNTIEEVKKPCEVESTSYNNQSTWNIVFILVSNTIRYSMHMVIILFFIAMWFGALRVEFVDVQKYPPYFPYKTPVMFEEDHRYDPEARDSIELWRNVTSNQKYGILYFRHPERHGLIESKNDEIFVGWQEYSVGMFHQLHCLGIIQQKYYGHEVSHHDKVPHHIDHCFDYLRQSIMCTADTTLEHTNGTGWGVEHQCRDMKAVLAFLEQHNGWGVYRKGAKLRD